MFKAVFKLVIGFAFITYVLIRFEVIGAVVLVVLASLLLWANNRP